MALQGLLALIALSSERHISVPFSLLTSLLQPHVRSALLKVQGVAPTLGGDALQSTAKAGLASLKGQLTGNHKTDDKRDTV